MPRVPLALSQDVALQFKNNHFQTGTLGGKIITSSLILMTTQNVRHAENHRGRFAPQTNAACWGVWKVPNHGCPPRKRAVKRPVEPTFLLNVMLCGRGPPCARLFEHVIWTVTLQRWIFKCHSLNADFLLPLLYCGFIEIYIYMKSLSPSTGRCGPSPLQRRRVALHLHRDWLPDDEGGAHVWRGLRSGEGGPALDSPEPRLPPAAAGLRTVKLRSSLFYFF